jgi:hypothetical protein
MKEFFIAAAGFIVALGAVSAALGIIAKSPLLGKPLRWLWQTNVSHPISAWHRTITGEVVDQRIEHLMHHRNGGSSLLDLAESVKDVKHTVGQLLEHDAERDTAGKRYGPHPDLESDHTEGDHLA